MRAPGKILSILSVLFRQFGGSVVYARFIGIAVLYDDCSITANLAMGYSLSVLRICFLSHLRHTYFYMLDGRILKGFRYTNKAVVDSKNC